MKILYRCHKVNSPLDCQEYTTDPKTFSGDSGLRTHNIQCPVDIALQSVGLYRENDEKNKKSL